MSSRIRDEIPRQCEYEKLPDGIHMFHAYIDNGYCWVKVIHIPTEKTVKLFHFPLTPKVWKRQLFLCLQDATTMYRDRAAEKHAKAARFYRSSFEPC
jgi:hypothetical protein